MFLMELPWHCKMCNHENMIDTDNLEIWPLDKIVSAQGFQCENCQTMEVVLYQTTSLMAQIDKLLRYSPKKQNYYFLFMKSLKKAKGIHLRGEALYGEIRRKNMVAA